VPSQQQQQLEAARIKGPTSRPLRRELVSVVDRRLRSPVERTLNKTGWADGFAITADRVTATPQDGSVELAIALSYENMVAATHTPTNTPISK